MDPVAARTRMVEQQLRARGIRDERVLDAFLRCRATSSSSRRCRGSAYGDHALPIGHGQTISQPYMVALMTEALRPEPDDRVLEIGTGSGYQAAILARLVRTVFTVERIPALAQRAQKILADASIANVFSGWGTGPSGGSSSRRSTGSSSRPERREMPDSLREQLADGGASGDPDRGRVAAGAADHRAARRWLSRRGELPLFLRAPDRARGMAGRAGLKAGLSDCEFG